MSFTATNAGKHNPFRTREILTREYEKIVITRNIKMNANTNETRSTKQKNLLISLQIDLEKMEIAFSDFKFEALQVKKLVKLKICFEYGVLITDQQMVEKIKRKFP